MKRFFLLNTLLAVVAAAIAAPAAFAQGSDYTTAKDLDGDGSLSIQEIRLHYLNRSSK